MTYVLALREIDETNVALLGGKGASLGVLSRLEGVHVPAGFCVTTEAFERFTAQGAVAMPDDVAAAITRSLTVLGAHAAYAVRSSAIREDSPTASFAGQHDSYLDVVGVDAILEHVRRCWASLYTERAVAYRVRNGFDHGTARMAVVVQRMVAARAAGVLFTADPVTGNRKVTAIEAVVGLGEALVSGGVTPDRYQVRDDAIVDRTIASSPAALTDAEVLRLARLGRRIEAHLGGPQDVEWCLADDELHVVQSRPITTLFPIPVAHDDERHVYICVGHGQMMTDAMKPLGLSLFQHTALRPMPDAGGRLFVDVTRQLASAATRTPLLAMIGRSDPLTGDALQTLVDRGDVIRAMPGAAAPPPTRSPSAPVETDPAIVTQLIARTQASLAVVEREIPTKTGVALLDFILTDLHELKRVLFDPESHQVIMAAMEAAWWLRDQLQAWLGDKTTADAIAQSLPDNVTSQMGLALLRVADVIRPHAAVVAFLRGVHDDRFLEELPAIPGGREAREAIDSFLATYGMRCVGEIDITRPRWSERPSTLLPILLANIDNFAPGAGEQRFERGRQEARRAEREVLERLRSLPDGEEKAEQTRRMIERVRTFAGYREYPKYGKIWRYFLYKQALRREADRFVDTGVLSDRADIDYLTLEELREVMRTHHVDGALLRERKAEFRAYEALTPPRVLTSDGEMIHGAYRRTDVPRGALVGLAVSAGTVEGRARVIRDIAQADLEPGDILVTTATDPSWTPLFVTIAALVTEVGGLMTHGAVIAREYGVPAVVGVPHAARRIVDGQRIRVHGTEGYVELL